MVKAPRSKGCRVCVDRRVKCDQRRPFCLRCEKANRQCPGYDVISFVDEGPSVRELYKNVSRGDNVERRVSSASSSDVTQPQNLAPFEYLNRAASGEEDTTHMPVESNRQPDFERSTLVAIMAPTVYQAQLLSSFINSVSSKDAFKLNPTFYCHSVWLCEIAGRSEISSTLLWAIRALSLSHLGRQIQDRYLVENSRHMYGKALLKLNKALQDPEEGLGSDTLSATVLLSLYELLNCTDKLSWVRHAGGAANLVRLRGPDRHRTGFDRAIFIACRHSILLESFQTRKPCFLASTPWRNLSREIWDNLPDRSPFTDAREDVFQECLDHPGWIAEVLQCMATDTQDSTKLRDIIQRGQTHRSNLKTTQARLGDTLKDMGLEPTALSSHVDDKLFPRIYHYHNILIASHYCAYWALLTILNIALIGLESKLASYDSPPISRNRPTQPKYSTDRAATFDPRSQTVSPRDEDETRIGTYPWLWSLALDAQRSMSLPLRSATASPMEYTATNAEDIRKRRDAYVAENIRNARDTCQSVESVCRNSALLGPLFLVFGLRNALRVLKSPEEQSWIKGKLNEIGKTYAVAKSEAEIYQQESGGVE